MSLLNNTLVSASTIWRLVIRLPESSCLESLMVELDNLLGVEMKSERPFSIINCLPSTHDEGMLVMVDIDMSCAKAGEELHNLFQKTVGNL